MSIVREIRQATGMTQAELATLAGTSQPTVAAYESGAKIPSLRTIRRLAEAAGLFVEMRVVPVLTREDRRSLAIHRRIAERLSADPKAVIRRARSNIANMRRLHPHASGLLDHWEHMLDGPVDRIIEVMTDASLWGRELRQVTPFAGVLEAGERAEVIRSFQKEEAKR